MRLKEKIFLTTLYLLRMDKECPEYELPQGCELKRLIKEDINIVSAANRDRKTIEGRLGSGDVAYWVERHGGCVNIQWYSSYNYFVWDIRSTVIFPKGATYIYDTYTCPKFRRKGVNKAALSGLIRDAGLLVDGPIFSLTQKKNAMGWGFLEKFGFERKAEVSLLQIPPVRYYMLRKAGDRQIRVRIMTMHNTPEVFDLDSIRFI
jgi:ribosomal protein S18 acetylase RimI-like enzyme